jgi:PadR family transcriptional regulator, regulatory protein PadR
MKKPRMSPHTFVILEAFASQPVTWRYGYELSQETDLKAGTLYPLLMRLTKHSLLEAKWVTTEKGTPPRHMYRLTDKGLRFAKEKLTEQEKRVPLRPPAVSKGRA